MSSNSRRDCGQLGSDGGVPALHAEIIAVPDSAFDGAALLVSVPAGADLTSVREAIVEAGATLRSVALVGSHATRYKVPR